MLQGQLAQREQEISDLYANLRRQRLAYESMKDILVAASGPDPNIEWLDSIIRTWVARA